MKILRKHATAPRVAIVLNDGQWFVRRIALVHEDSVHGEMAYHCDEHLGGPYATLSEVPLVADLLRQERRRTLRNAIAAARGLSKRAAEAIAGLKKVKP